MAQKVIHNKTSYEAPECFVNWKEAHNAYSKDCPMWRKEKQTQSIKATTGVAFQEARKIVGTSFPTLPFGLSYAKIAKSMIKRKTRNIETQTIINRPEGENPKSRQSKSIEVQTE